MTNFSTYTVKLFKDMSSGTGHAEPSQGNTIALHISTTRSDEQHNNATVKFSILHEFSHIWDHATGNRLSAGMLQATGGRYSTRRRIIGTYPFNEIVSIYEPFSPIQIPKGYYGRDSRGEDWAEAVVAVVAPKIA